MGLFCIIIGMILFILFVHPMFAGVVNAGNVFGVFFSVLLFLYGLFRKSIPQGMRRGVRILALLGCLLLAVLGVVIAKGARKTPQEPCTVVVLGCGLNGERPSLILQKRIRAAYDYLTDNPSAACICSGGQGEDELISEAECIYRELRAMGIEQERLYKEDRSTSTLENLSFSVEIIRENDLTPALALATSEFHCYRAVKMAEKLGYTAYALQAGTMISFLPTYFLRECFAVLKMWILPE